MKIITIYYQLLRSIKNANFNYISYLLKQIISVFLYI